MANNRKVQSEIDKLIKKIEEGKEVYDEVYEKFKDAPTQPLKERFESDLKKEIKKLQRLREQVKGFIQNPDVKDKRQMEEKRREIEEKMEDFKVCERETKTKAYSKEGLANARNDNLDTPLGRTQSWINESLSDLKQQIETAEFDVQEISGGAKKRRGKSGSKTDSDDPRIVRLARLKRHVMRLEQLLRMLTNEELEPAEVDEIEDQVQDMIENNVNEDYESDGDIYEPFALPDVVVKEDDEEELAAERERERQRQIEQAKVAAAALEKKNAAAAAAVVKADPKAEAPGGRVIVIETKKKDQDAAKNTPTTVATPNDSSTPHSKVVPTPPTESATPATPSSPASSLSKKQPEAPGSQVAKKSVPAAATTPSAPSPTTSSSNYTQPSASAVSDRFKAANPYVGNDATLEALEEGEALLDDDMDAANDDTFNDDLSGPTTAGTLADLSNMTAVNNNKGDWGKGRPSTLTPPSAQKPSAPVAPQPAALSPTSPSAPSSLPVAATTASTTTTATPAAAPAAKLNPLEILNRRKEEVANMLRPLEVSSRNLPHATDVEKIKITPPANPTTTPSCFPDKPFRGFNNPELLRKFDAESLFFIFYYQQSSYLQYLAAKELKRIGFRYHTKFHTWFQRHEKPSLTHEQYEQGSYIYFDYENGWCQRVKRDFQFKYQYLEDDLD